MGPVGIINRKKVSPVHAAHSQATCGIPPSWCNAGWHHTSTNPLTDVTRTHPKLHPRTRRPSSPPSLVLQGSRRWLRGHLWCCRCWLSRAAWRVWWSRSARLGALRAASAYRRAASSSSPFFSWRCAATASRARDVLVDLGQCRQACGRAVGLADGDGTVEPDDRACRRTGAARRTTPRSGPSRSPRRAARRHGARRSPLAPGTRRAGRAPARPAAMPMPSAMSPVSHWLRS